MPTRDRSSYRTVSCLVLRRDSKHNDSQYQRLRSQRRRGNKLTTTRVAFNSMQFVVSFRFISLRRARHSTRARPQDDTHRALLCVGTKLDQVSSGLLCCSRTTSESYRQIVICIRINASLSSLDTRTRNETSASVRKSFEDSIGTLNQIKFEKLSRSLVRVWPATWNDSQRST